MIPIDLPAIYRAYISCLNERNWQELEQFVDEHVIHDGKPIHLAGYREMLEQQFCAAPDFQAQIEFLVCNPPRLACRLQYAFTAQASLLGLPIISKKASFCINDFYEFRDGKICQVWSFSDRLSSTDFSGRDNPKEMPLHFFAGADAIDYATAIRANTEVQHCSITPRQWYIDARFSCVDCGERFLWSAKEQKIWFEVYHFWIDSQPRHCRDCRAKRRDSARLKQDYDRLIGPARSGGTLQEKAQIVEIIDAMEDQMGSIAEKLKETRALFKKQIAKGTRTDDDRPAQP